MIPIYDPSHTAPFRWNLTNQVYLGSLVEGEKAAAYDEFLDQLLPCCSRVLAFAGNSDLAFVGRSPESIFDHLSGLLFDTSWAERLLLLQFSWRFQPEATLRQQYPVAIAALRSYFEQLDLHPQGLITRSRPVAFIDLVSGGNTFGRLVHLLHQWTQETQTDWGKVRRKIRLVGITWKKKTSPHTWRWQQHVEWRSLLLRDAVKNVSIPSRLWDYLGNDQDKVTRSYSPNRWGDPAAARPSYGEEQLRALRLAWELFEKGKTPEQREKFAALLVQEPAMKQAWFRGLVREIRS